MRVDKLPVREVRFLWAFEKASLTFGAIRVVRRFRNASTGNPQKDLIEEALIRDRNSFKESEHRTRTYPDALFTDACLVPSSAAAIVRAARSLARRRGSLDKCA